jgi:PAS domain S-box-containing protein
MRGNDRVTGPRPRPGDEKSPPGVHDARLAQTVGLAVVGMTPETVVTSYNPVAQALLGWTTDSGIGRSFTDHAVEHPDALAAETLVDELSAGRSWTGRVTCPTPQAVVRAGPGSAPATAVPVLDDEGRVIGGLVLFLEPESALWPVLTGALDGWLVVHNAGRISYASRQVTRLLGRTLQDMQELSVASPSPTRPERLGPLLARRTQARAGDGPTEFQVTGADGASRWIEAQVIGSNEDGPLQGALWRLRDVTGRRRLDDRQQARARELQAALESRVVIEQAKGFLCGRDGGTPEAAFLRLRRHARDHNLTLRELARRLMAGEISLPPLS